MERRTIRYARRRVAGRLLEPNRAQSLWRNRMGRLYLAAPHGRTELILGVAETVPAPKGMAWGLYSNGDCPFETWLVDRRAQTLRRPRKPHRRVRPMAAVDILPTAKAGRFPSQAGL